MWTDLCLFSLPAIAQLSSPSETSVPLDENCYLNWLPFLSFANRWKQSTPSLVSKLYLCHLEHFRWGKLLVMPFGTADYSAFTNTLLFGGCLVSPPAFVFACRQHYSLVGICYSSLQCNKQKVSEVKLLYSHREATQGD